MSDFIDDEDEGSGTQDGGAISKPLCARYEFAPGFNSVVSLRGDRRFRALFKQEDDANRFEAGVRRHMQQGFDPAELAEQFSGLVLLLVRVPAPGFTIWLILASETYLIMRNGVQQGPDHPSLRDAVTAVAEILKTEAPGLR